MKHESYAGILQHTMSCQPRLLLGLTIDIQCDKVPHTILVSINKFCINTVRHSQISLSPTVRVHAQRVMFLLTCLFLQTFELPSIATARHTYVSLCPIVRPLQILIIYNALRLCIHQFIKYSKFVTSLPCNVIRSSNKINITTFYNHNLY